MTGRNVQACIPQGLPDRSRAPPLDGLTDRTADSKSILRIENKGRTPKLLSNPSHPSSRSPCSETRPIPIQPRSPPRLAERQPRRPSAFASDLVVGGRTPFSRHHASQAAFNCAEVAWRRG